jgi:hypothetical protein
MKHDEPGFYLLPMDHPIAIENVRRHSSEAKCLDNMFSDDDLNWVWKNAFTDDSVPRLNKNGTVIVDTDMTKVYDKFKDKILECVGEDAANTCAIGGNYFITPQQYGLHMDAMREKGYRGMLESVPLNDEQRVFTTWKNFILPLWIGTNDEEQDGGQIVFFEQRDIGWAKVYNGGNQTPGIASIYEIVTDYTNIQFYDRNGTAIPREKNAEPFDKDFHSKYLNTPYRRVQGLSAENVFDWVPGTPMVFDAVQLHATNEGSKDKNKKMWNSKMGLLMMFYKELDEDLKEQWRKEQATM